MKYFTFILSALILFSCSDEPSEEVITNEITQDTLIEEKTTGKDTAVTEELAVQENELTIDDFPKKWFKLTEQNQDYIVFSPCEAETSQLWLEEDNGAWYVTVLYGQDSQRFKILNFDAYEEKRDNFQVVYGMIVLENPDYPDMDAEMYEYLWNKDLMFCNFYGFFQDETMMVSEQNLDNYEFVKEDCSYLEENE